jgi:zinc transporter 1/2/3
MNAGWNQSPPRFAADLTTRQDLNGIANARELGDADRLGCGSRCLRHLELQDTSIEEMEKQPLMVGEGVKGSPKGVFTSKVRNEYRLLTSSQDLAPTQPHL